MSTVYVVTSGKWSNYGIVGVFSDHETAERYVARHNLGMDDDAYGAARVETYQMDELRELAETSLRYWSFWFDDGGGVVREMSALDGDEVISLQGIAREILYVTVRAADRDTALKVAAERRAVYLAEREGIAV
jgi:hypothetical protein